MTSVIFLPEIICGCAGFIEVTTYNNLKMKCTVELKIFMLHIVVVIFCSIQ